ncbi:hypothetical protein [Streptomyces roseochromogenus]|uniref:Uncharacterized protein n=1 Tax=Streptomyces roseochromogenus subsp. oscitans DS 12.976 TaxID=1352936 RepID=V6KCT1_STRRC|nr:hypothetical protein [Streptomyces roseochromogenus]EST29226.1 hypothetical protein M878_20865 [Streptomyces roseochromogenus subsp. oscitans DS 12.976]
MPAPLSSAALAKRLLDESDLGEGYTRTPQPPAQHDDMTVIGCPALEKRGSEVAVGCSLDFPHEAKSCARPTSIFRNTAAEPARHNR